MWLLVSLFVSFALGQFDPTHYCQGVPLFANNARSGFALQQVQVITRHGDRTPVNVITPALENVVWNCTDFAELFGQSISSRGRVFRKNYMEGRNLLRGNCLFGQLTQRGALQHQLLGRNFRAVYVNQLNFLSPTLDLSEVAIRSTDVERTILSAYNFFAGLYPFTEQSGQTVPLYTMDNARENMYPNSQFCPALTRIWNRVAASQNYTNIYNVRD